MCMCIYISCIYIYIAPSRVPSAPCSRGVDTGGGRGLTWELPGGDAAHMVHVLYICVCVCVYM